jgi:rhodanese-related sulfurtransferase
MQFRNMLLVAIAATALIGVSAFARAVQHDHGSTKSADSKGSAEGAKPEMMAKDLKARLDKGDKIIIIDARHDLGGQILKGAIHVPSDKLDDWAKSADKNAVIVTYCTCPHDEAAEAEVQSLQKMGFKNSFSLKGGLDAARAAGIEVVTPVDK